MRPSRSYDRYSNEYARFWWDLVSPLGYGYNWGRSQGLVSYLDTLEIAAFLGEHPEFRPVKIEEIASLYHLAWRWIRKDYSDRTHLFTVFAFGRGNYGYINPQREWQQTGTGFGKIILAHDSLMKTLESENVASFPAAPRLADIARFEFFEKKADRQFGVWLVRQGRFQFALPITTGTKPAIADYLPAPFGLPGFAAPVEEVYPSLVPFLEMEGGKTYATSEGASEIFPSDDGKSLKIVWRKWARVGSKSGEVFAKGLTSQVEFKIENSKLVRRETLTAEKDLVIKKWRVAVPATGNEVVGESKNGASVFTFRGREGALRAEVKTDWKTDSQIAGAGDTRLGKGVLGAIPLHLICEAKDLEIKKGQPMTWEISLELLK